MNELVSIEGVAAVTAALDSSDSLLRRFVGDTAEAETDFIFFEMFGDKWELISNSLSDPRKFSRADLTEPYLYEKFYITMYPPDLIIDFYQNHGWGGSPLIRFYVERTETCWVVSETDRVSDFGEWVSRYYGLDSYTGILIENRIIAEFEEFLNRCHSEVFPRWGLEPNLLGSPLSGEVFLPITD